MVSENDANYYSLPERNANQQMVLMLALIEAIRSESDNLRETEDHKLGWRAAMERMHDVLEYASRKEKSL